MSDYVIFKISYLQFGGKIMNIASSISRKIKIVLLSAVICLLTACSTQVDNYTLAELEPYINHIGEVLNGNTLTLASDKEQENLNKISIANVEGSITYSITSLGEAFNIASTLIWESNKTNYTETEYNNVRQAILNYYNINTNKNFDKKSTELKCKNNLYTIDCKLNDTGSITIKWFYNTDNYNQNKVAGYAAINILKNILKNPDSLQVHDVGYTRDSYCLECEDAVGIKIEYSAQNGFGGYNRDSYYIFINPNNYSQVKTFLEPKISLESKIFTSINVDDLSSMKASNDIKCKTEIISLDNTKYQAANSIMSEKLVSYLPYLEMTYAESGFNTNQASNTLGTRYPLDKAEFLGEESHVFLWYDNTNNDSIASSLEISTIKFSLDELKEKISTQLNTKPYDEDEYSFYVDIPDTDLKIHASYVLMDKHIFISKK